MSGYGYVNGQTSVVLRVKLNNSSATIPNNIGLTGLTIASAGLIISTICDNEAAASVYSQAGGTLQTIATLGTYAAPSASNARFKEVDATNHPGVYELQLLNSRFAVTSAKSLLISFPAVSGLNLAQMDLVIPLSVIDPYNPQTIWTSQMSESYSALATAETPAQALFEIIAMLQQRTYSGTTVTWKKRDGSTTAMTGTLNAATGATNLFRAT